MSTPARTRPLEVASTDAPPPRRKPTFWNDAATKRDLVAGGAVLAICVVFAIVGAVTTAIRLNDALDQARGKAKAEQDRRVELAESHERVERELGRLEAAAASSAATTREQARTITVLRRRLVTLEQTGRSGAPGASAGPDTAGTGGGSGSPPPQTDGVRQPLAAPGPPAGERPRLRPQRPPRRLPQRPPRATQPIAPTPPPRPSQPIATPPPPRPAQPIVRPPAPTQPPTPTPTPTPPRPGNKPPHAPCPPRNPNCG